MSEVMLAFSALNKILDGDWDHYLLRLRAAINSRMDTQEWRDHIVAVDSDAE